MKFTVKIEDRVFNVELKDISARPIVAIVDGEAIEVWPENGNGNKMTQPASVSSTQSKQPALQPGPRAKTGLRHNGTVKQVRAPIPGVVISVAVQPGDEVEPGQDLLVLEAMKMKNLIRANRAGKIAAVKVSAGQTVQNKDVLIEFED